MFPALDLRVAAAIATTLATGIATALVPPGPGWAQQSEDAVGIVEDLYFVVESLDGSETLEREDTEVTVTLTSDVLFALDEAKLTTRARDRLASVADQIRADGAGGVITIAGRTDDQGSDSYNRDLSGRRAESVRAELADLLADVDVQFETTGYGESRPRVPNIVDGEPNDENRARTVGWRSPTRYGTDLAGPGPGGRAGHAGTAAAGVAPRTNRPASRRQQLRLAGGVG